MYRPQRGSLQDSMKEMKTFKTEDEMFFFIAQELNSMLPGPHLIIDEKEDLVIMDDVGPDERIGWSETRLVCAKRMGPVRYETPQAIGYCCFINDKDPLKELSMYHLEVAGGDSNKLCYNTNPVPISEPVNLYSIRYDGSLTVELFMVKATSYDDAWNRFWMNINSITEDHPDMPCFGYIDNYHVLEEGHYVCNMDPGNSFIITEYDIRSNDLMYIGSVDK